jgi:predicted permease
MFDILTIAMPFFGLIFFGVLAAKIWRIEEEGLAWINVFILYFALPAMIYLIVAAAPFEQLVNWRFPATTVAATGFCFLLVVAMGRWWFGVPLRVATLQGTSASYGNIGYMGLPLSVAFFGPTAAVPAAIVFCFDCVIQFLLTASLASMGEKGGGGSWRLLRSIVTHPFIVSTVLGGLASAYHFEVGGGFKTILEMLGKAAGPTALFAMGVTVALRNFGGFGKEMFGVVFVKTLFQPAVAFIVVSLFAGVDHLWVSVAVMMASLPTASNAFILARQYGAYKDGAGAAVIITTIISVLTIPAIVYVLRHGF